MEDSGKVSAQPKVEHSEREGERAGNSTVRSHSTKSSPPYMVFTYFKGDIDTKVDEHFSRALKQSSHPSEIHSKTKAHIIEAKTDGKQSPHQWSPRAPMWSSPHPGPTLSTLPVSSASVPMPESQYRQGSHQSLHAQQHPHDPWLLPGVSSIYHQPIPGLHQMMPASVNSRQYSSVLVPLRGARAAPEPSQQQTDPKTNFTAVWPGPDAELAVNPDMGFQHPPRRKDVYWY
ncbi:transcription cofactor vestigial-like protein 1 [Scyliorhinus torazame]|uniref:transcription cofactor vestigial-like protein 1 n=1 Tax=Scyliorhinus torazame TaxID=75743 RepID=UPI003B58DB87